MTKSNPQDLAEESLLQEMELAGIDPDEKYGFWAMIKDMAISLFRNIKVSAMDEHEWNDWQKKDDDSNDLSDICYDPSYSHLSCNIYHRD